VRRLSVLSIAAAFALGAASAPAVTLVGVSFTDGLVYRVDPATGAASDPHAVDFGQTALNMWSGVEIAPDGTMLLATVQAAAQLPSHLVALSDAAQVHADSSVALGQQIGEGDLALDPLTGDLYAFGLTNLIAPFLLLRIERGPNGWADPTTTVVGEIGTTDVSGLAFDAAGRLYALDTDADALLTLDPSDASTLSSVDLSEPVGALAGMDFDSASGTLYVADGGAGGRDMLFTLDPATGILDEIGPLGLANGLSGLAVPEPAATAAGAVVLGSLARWRLRRLS
jgi:DNA-binding beta-propeller fold protein YncE